ncbi:MAG TPA: hypothetical protein VFS57_10930 [Gemmatimonadaceae bacterium]|nr:hypothetical protein [Gemmatimonadaceae bacterium]
MNRSQVDSEHLTSGQVAAILDERLRGPDRAPAMAHLAACAECRREMAELHEALHEHALLRRTKRPWLILASGVAAALVLAVLPGPLGRTRHMLDVPAATRAPNGRTPVDAAPPIDVVAPADGAAISVASSLTWRSVGSGASYLVTVQDTSGAVIWSSTLTDTTTTLPSNAELVAGHRYFWTVDARLGDGASTTTGVRAFTIR